MNCLNLDTYIDFYFLQAMMAEPPDTMKPAGEKLWNDIQEINTHLVDKFDKVLLQYTFIASCGEARHGFHGPGKFIPELPVGGHRAAACHAAKLYEPNEHNFALLSKLFGMGWHGGYGGKAWKNITDAGLMRSINTLDKVSFIDHAANLEHNGGCYFNKTSAGDECKLSLTFSTGNFKNFLAHKAVAPSLLTYNWPKICTYLNFGTEVGGLVHRYFVVVRKEEPPAWLKKSIITDYAKFEPINMGDKQFSDIIAYTLATGVGSTKAGKMGAIQQAQSMAQMYAQQYDMGESYDTDAQTIAKGRDKDESAKEYWNGQSFAEQPAGHTIAEQVSLGKYTSIALG